MALKCNQLAHIRPAHPVKPCCSRIAARRRAASLIIVSLATILLAATAVAQVQNGSFESGSAGWAFSGAVRVLTGVGANGSVGAQFNYGQLEPNGTITQSFATAPGQTYTLEFDAGAFSVVNQSEQRVAVTVQGSTTLLARTVSVLASGDGVRYVGQQFTFAADSTTTTLTFADVSPATKDLDLLIDNVRVAAPTGAALVITSQPASATVSAGGTVTFKVGATGAGALKYEWRFNGGTIPGADSSSYTISSIQTSHAGLYDVVVSDPSGSVTSATATLTVVSSTPASTFANGSFELDYLGWIPAGNQVIVDGLYGLVPSAGSKAIAFNVGQKAPNGTLSQTFVTTAGQSYNVSFDLGAFSMVNHDEQRMQVAVTGLGTLVSRVLSVTAPGGGAQYAPQSISFTADGPATTLTFTDASALTQDVDLLLDNVQITAGGSVPPPPPPPPGTGTIDAGSIAAIEALSGLSFTDTQRNMILDVLSGGVRDWADGQMLSLRGWDNIAADPLLNGKHPAVIFDPRPTGVVIDQNQQAISWSPARSVTPPANRADLAFLSVRDLAELLRTRQITSTELTQLYLSRLKQYGPTLLCVVTLTEELALRRAQQADAEIAAGNYRGLLHGIPYGLKDVFAVQGYPTTWGATPFRTQVIDQSATVYNKLDQAGAVLVAKLATGELAFGDWWFGGQTRNPWDPTTSSGGSSSGPASATAAGLVAFAIGTETMGSIVDPCTRCRVTGLRSTFGRVSRAGAMALAWSMDQVGPIARTVEDCAIVLHAIQGKDPLDPSTESAAFNFQASRGLIGRKVGYVPGSVSSAVLSTISSLGGTPVAIGFPNYPVGAMLSILAVEAAAGFDSLTRAGGLDQLRQQGTYHLPNLIRTARTVSAVDYLQADRLRREMVNDVAAVLRAVDLYVAPYAIDVNLAMANLLGLPCVTIPHGSGASLLFVGKVYDDAVILEAALSYQNATGYHLERPPLFSK